MRGALAIVIRVTRPASTDSRKGIYGYIVFSVGVTRQNNFAMLIVKYFDVLGKREFVASSVFTKFQVFRLYSSCLVS